MSEVTFNAEKSRYEVTVDGAVAGFADVLTSDTHVVFTHTEVDDAYQGQGLAAALAGEALAQVASSGRTVVPVCPYIARYVERHPIEGLAVEMPERP